MRSPPSISIALAAYNGGTHLGEQLASIANQTRLPDELVAADDRSTDNTLAILNAFSTEAPFAVRIVQNDKNLGLPHNFERAISICRGDIIAISDQDDYWLPTKLARAETALLESPQVGAVFSNAEVVDAKLRSLGYTVWDNAKFTQRRQQQILGGEAHPVLLKNNVVQAATLTFRAEFLRFILPIPEGWETGAWVALVVGSMADLSIVPDVLLKYRQHACNQIGAPKRTFVQKLRRSQERHQSSIFAQQENLFLLLRDRLESCNSSLLKPDTLRLLDEKIAHLHLRASMPQSRLKRLPIALNELRANGYHRYSLGGFGSFVSDLLLSRSD